MRLNLITIAISKGRSLNAIMSLLASINIEPTIDPITSRKLIIPTNHEHIRLILIRGIDIPTHISHGSAQLGMVGKDILLETGDYNSYYEPLDLKIGKCELVRAAFPSAGINNRQQCRVATKYVKSAKQYYDRLGIQTEIIKLHGAVEIAPALHLADEIVDLVETGKTLKANGLQIIEPLTAISTRLIVNKAALKCHFKQINALVQQLKLTIQKPAHLDAG